MEASFVIPIVLLIYALVITGGFYLYDRCVMSQDNYLLAFRGSRFTAAEKKYGEVIYGNLEEGYFLENYLTERLIYKVRFYPLAQAVPREISINGNEVTVSVNGFEETLKISKKAKQVNPMKNIKNVRRQPDGS